jgi:hypothetical protein
MRGTRIRCKGSTNHDATDAWARRTLDIAWTRLCQRVEASRVDESISTSTCSRKPSNVLGREQRTGALQGLARNVLDVERERTQQ